MKCENCECKHDGKYGSGRFCSTKCARGFSTKEKRKEINEKVSITIRRNHPRTYVEIVCKQCGKTKALVTAKRHQQTCNRRCGIKWTWNKENPNFQKHLDNSRKSGLKSARIQSETRRSKNEIMFANLCKEKFDEVLCNVDMFNGWDADVIIPELKIAIHWNGKWHYEKITKKHSVKQVQNRDKLKYENVKSLGYNNYVIKDLGREDPEFVNEQFKIFIGLYPRCLINSALLG